MTTKRSGWFEEILTVVCAAVDSHAMEKVTAEWSSWFKWTDIARPGGMSVPRGPGVYEARVQGGKDRLGTSSARKCQHADTASHCDPLNDANRKTPAIRLPTRARQGYASRG